MACGHTGRVSYCSFGVVRALAGEPMTSGSDCFFNTLINRLCLLVVSGGEDINMADCCDQVERLRKNAQKIALKMVGSKLTSICSEGQSWICIMPLLFFV